jgi:hypothetical protein
MIAGSDLQADDLRWADFAMWTNIGAEFRDVWTGKSQIKVRVRQDVSMSSTTSVDTGKGSKSTIDTLTVLLDAGSESNPNQM